MQRNTTNYTKPPESNHNTEPIDEDVQYQIIQKVRNDFQRQNERMRKSWWMVCVISSLLSLFAPYIMNIIHEKMNSNVLTEDISMIQCVCSFILHLCSGFMGDTKNIHQEKPIKVGVVATFIPICFYVCMSQMHDVSFYIAMSNVITMISGIFVRRSAIDSLKCIQDLEKSKYRFKNLWFGMIYAPIK